MSSVTLPVTTCYTTVDSVSTGAHPATLNHMTDRLGSYIRDERERRGWTQTELAEKAGVPKQTVNRLETGTTKLPGALIRRQLADALGVQHLDLLIAAGEITVEEANPPADTRSAAVRRLQPLIDSVQWNEGTYRMVEGLLVSIRDMQSGAFTEPKASWEDEE